MLIKGTEIAVDNMGRWSANDLAYVLRLDFHADDLLSSSVLLVALFQPRGTDGWPDPHHPMWEVAMRFSGVSGLRFTSFGGGPVQIMGFEIASVADRGWEGIRFEISDYEDSRLAFMCADVEILNVKEKQHSPST